jgi:hypothetical protein
MAKEKIEERVTKLIAMLKRYDDKEEYSPKIEKELEKIKYRIVSKGSEAVPYLIELLKDTDTWSSSYVIEALGEIGDDRAIAPLVDIIEYGELGEEISEALKKFGPKSVPQIIKKVEYRIANPTDDDEITTDVALGVIGEIKCEESITFLNNLLDEYMSEIPEGIFDPTKHDWRFKNIDIFQILDSMVCQQDKRAIPHIRKARDFFQKENIEYIICQIAIGRIKKRRPDEGYLPLEALEITMPSGAIMNALTHGDFGWEDTLQEDYGEYLNMSDDDEDEDE